MNIVPKCSYSARSSSLFIGLLSVIGMGVDHGGGVTGDKSLPRIWSRETLMQIVPPQILSGIKWSGLWLLKYVQIRFPGPYWVLTMLPQIP